MKNRIIAILQIIVNLAFIPMYYTKIFQEVGVFPGQDAMGNFVTDRRYFYYSVYQKLSWDEEGFYIHLSLCLISSAIAFAILSMAFKDNKKIRYAGYIVSAVSALVFIAILAYTSTIMRSY